MKLKFLTVLSLTALLGAAGCGRGDSNNANANRANTNSAVTTSSPMATTTPMATATATPAASDSAAKAAVEDALKKKGITGVTVDATAAEVTLRGTVAKGKMTEAVQAAQEAGKRKVNNQLTESK